MNVTLLDADGSLGLQTVHALNKAKIFTVKVLSPLVSNALRFSRLCKYEFLEGWDWNEGPQQLEKHATIDKNNILLPVTTSAMKWMVHHADELKRNWTLPFLPTALNLETVLNKSLFFSFLKTHNLPTASSYPLLEVLTTSDTLSFPALIKPCEGSGGRGIIKVNSRMELFKVSEGISSPEKYILQNYIEGTDVSYGVFCKNGCIEAAVGYQCLSRHQEYGPFKSIEVIEDPLSFEAVSTLMKSLNWNGLANVDLRIGRDEQVYLLEMNPRMWANIRNVVVSGCNFVEIACLSAVGEKHRAVPIEKKTFFNPSGAFSILFRKLQWKPTPPFKWENSAFPYILKDPIPYFTILCQRLHVNGFLSVKRGVRSVFFFK